MKALIRYPFLLLLVVSGCASNSKMAKRVDDVLTSKRYKEALVERDELCAANRQLRKDTSDLGKIVRKQEMDIREGKQRYEMLTATTGSELARLSEGMMNKSKELEKKERQLQEREQKLRELQSVVAMQDSIVKGLNDLVKNALLGFNSDELSVEMKGGKVYVSMSDKLLFRSASAEVEAKGRQALKSLGEALNRNQEIDILIEGHTDNVPIKTALYKDNWDLSVARATSVVRLLNSEGKIDPRRMTASGRGEFFPVANNETEEGRGRNRRTEIVLSPRLDELFKLIQIK